MRGASFYELRSTGRPALCKQALDLIDPIFLLERELPSPDLEGDAELLALELRCQRRDLKDPSRSPRRSTSGPSSRRPSSTALAEALGYLLNHWDTLTAFLDDPLIPLDNNRTERALRDPVLGRKNRCGCRSVRGTQVAAIFYTLIETCILCGVDPEEYMRFTARALG